MATKMTTGKGQCPLSKIKGKDGKYMRKVRISADRCVDPTPANQRAAYKYQQKTAVRKGAFIGGAAGAIEAMGGSAGEIGGSAGKKGAVIGGISGITR